MMMNRLRMIAVSVFALSVAFLSTGCGDSLPPTVPENLTATAISDTEIDVDWDASTDYGGVEGYRVYRNGKKYAKIGSTGFRDTGLTNSTAYCYSVCAYDDEDNRSDKTDTVCATTFSGPGITAPEPATNLIANTVSASQISLSWTASISSNVKQYDIYRDSALIDNTVALTYQDNGLTNATSYCYYLITIDTSNNSSIKSNTDCTTTDP